LAVGGWAVAFGTAMRGLGGAAARPGPSSPAVPNVTVHPSTASVPITVLLISLKQNAVVYTFIIETLNSVTFTTRIDDF